MIHSHENLTAGLSVHGKVAALSTLRCPCFFLSFLFSLHPPPHPKFLLFLSSLVFMCHRQLLQLEGRCVSGLSWALSWPRLSLDPRVCPITSAAAAPYITGYSWSSPLPLINPLLTDSEMIKVRASKHFTGVITHSLAICLTSVPLWHRKPLY